MKEIRISIVYKQNNAFYSHNTKHNFQNYVNIYSIN